MLFDSQLHLIHSKGGHPAMHEQISRDDQRCAMNVLRDLQSFSLISLILQKAGNAIVQ